MRKVSGEWEMMLVPSVIDRKREDVALVFSIPTNQACMIHPVSFHGIALSAASRLAKVAWKWGHRLPVAVTVDQLVEINQVKHRIGVTVRISWIPEIEPGLDHHLTVLNILRSSVEEFVDFLNETESHNTIVVASSQAEAEQLASEQKCIVSIPPGGELRVYCPAEVRPNAPAAKGVN